MDKYELLGAFCKITSKILVMKCTERLKNSLFQIKVEKELWQLMRNTIWFWICIIGIISKIWRGLEIRGWYYFNFKLHCFWNLAEGEREKESKREVGRERGEGSGGEEWGGEGKEPSLVCRKI